MAQVVTPPDPSDERTTEEPIERRVAPVVPGTEWLVQRLHGPLQAMWARGFRFLFVLDAVALASTMVLINVIRFGREWPTYPTSHYAIGFSIATAIHLFINYFCGLYEREPRLGANPWLGRTLLATAMGVAVEGLAFVVLDRYLMPRLNLVIFGVVASFALAINRRVSRRLATRRQGPPRVVLVGTRVDVEMAKRHLADSDRDAVVVGSLETPDHLSTLITRHDATDVLLLDVDAFGSIFPEPLSRLEQNGIGFLQRVSARETLLGLRNMRQLAGMPFVRLQVHSVPSYKLVFKRLFDLVLTVATAPLWLFAFGVLALHTALRAGRPVLYRQERVGLDGRLFRVVKFRTMGVDAEGDGGAQLATAGDARIIAGMGWMRDTRADELPQLFNVLKGQMSLVGPRPERPELEQDLARRVPGYVRRHELPPGLTGLAQIHGHYATDAAYKLGYDLQYLVNWSPILDLQIIARTVWVVASRRV